MLAEAKTNAELVENRWYWVAIFSFVEAIKGK